MRRERATRIGVCVLLFATVALTGCRLAEHGKRAAIDAFASFVLGSISRAPLTQPAPKLSGAPALTPAPVASASVAAPPAPDRHECPFSTTLPQRRVVTIDLTPAAARIARVRHFIVVCPDVARVTLDARMALAEFRGARADRARIQRIVVVAPDLEIPPDPAAL